MIASLLIAISGMLAIAGTPKISGDRVVLRTDVGDVLLAFYPEATPKHVQQFLRLAKAGVLDSTHFYRIHAGFVAQTSTALDRTTPLTAAQSALIQKIPGEFGATPHVRGVLSMARADGDPNSADTSYSLMLGAAPHLDNQYTVFGQVERGMEILNEFERTAVDTEHHPFMRVKVLQAQVVSEAEAAKVILAPPRPMPQPTGAAALAAGKVPIISQSLVPCLVAVVLISFACVLLLGKVSESILLSLCMANVLLVGFVLLGLLTPVSRQYSWLGITLFGGLLMMFRQMSQFERKKPAPAQK